MSSVMTTSSKTQIVVSNEDEDSPFGPHSPSSVQPSPIASPLSHKYPHTRSLLVQLFREHRPETFLTSEATGDDDADALLPQVLGHLREENEDELKKLLKDTFDISDEVAEQNILDLMHNHRDDINQTPLFAIVASKRPLSRPSSRASSHSFRLVRPESPSSVSSSPKILGFRRPHTPAASPLVSALHANASSYMNVPISHSPASSPPLIHAAVLNLAAGSPSSSPLSSPRFLNAKEFKPGRPLSMGSNPSTPSSEIWAHNPSPNTSGSSLTRTSSNLAIAAPLILTPRSSTPVNGGNTATNSRPGSSLGVLPSRPPFDDEDDDEFSPFAKPRRVPTKPAPASSESNSENSASSPSNSYDAPTSNDEDLWSYPYPDHLQQFSPDDYEEDGDNPDPNAPEGMTPLEVLLSIFGATMTPAELENVLAQHGWNFEDAMQFLIDRPAPQSSFPPGKPGMNPRDVMALRHGQNQRMYPYGQVQRNMARPTRVCRYFLAGECLRADCRFSHDLDRALCRFWLRGNCAKGENCEFMHRLPPNMEGGPPFQINNGMQTPPRFDDRDGPITPDDFPALGANGDDFDDRRGGRDLGQFRLDPSRSRFAAALKKPMPSSAAGSLVSGSKFAIISEQRPDSRDVSPGPPLTPMPRPSPRIKLRPPTLLPTITTGDSLNKLYMTYRERPLQLQSARNACLARAADAWRRADGAGAKRFSRDANELNGKMVAEAKEAASRLVHERMRLLTDAVRRGEGGVGSDELAKRRGLPVGGNLGVCLGVARSDGANSVDTADMRMEVAIDLHGLHAAEGVDVLEEFIIALEREGHLGQTYAIVGEEKHTGTQDPSRGASRLRLTAAVKDWLYRWGYPWNEWNGIIAIDCLTHH